jgi:hypothetical protein
MFILDDLLLFPLRSALWATRQIAQAVNHQLAGEREALVQELSNLYRRLEAGEMGEAEFDKREEELLDRLEELEVQEEGSEEGLEER